MYKVRVVAWKEKRDVPPVSFAKAVRRYTGMDLVKSKAALDQLSKKGEAIVDFDDEADARAFVEEVSKLGARCEFTPR